MFRRSMISCALQSAALLYLFSPSHAIAQVQLSPSFGMYMPHGMPLLQEASLSGGVIRKQAVGGPVFTGRASIWLSHRAAVEATLSYSPALIAVHSAGHVEDRSAGLVLLSARSVFRLTPESINKFSIHAATGIGMVSRTGSAWSDTPAKPVPALVLATGARIPLTPRSGLMFRIDFEDYMSWTSFKLDDGTQLQSRPYHDLVGSFGIAIPLSRSKR